MATFNGSLDDRKSAIEASINSALKNQAYTVAEKRFQKAKLSELDDMLKRVEGQIAARDNANPKASYANFNTGNY